MSLVRKYVLFGKQKGLRGKGLLVINIFFPLIRDFRSPVITIAGQKGFCRMFVVFHTQHSGSVEVLAG